MKNNVHITTIDQSGHEILVPVLCTISNSQINSNSNYYRYWQWYRFLKKLSPFDKKGLSPARYRSQVRLSILHMVPYRILNPETQYAKKRIKSNRKFLEKSWQPWFYLVKKKLTCPWRRWLWHHANISANFRKNSKRSYRDTLGLGGNWLISWHCTFNAREFWLQCGSGYNFSLSNMRLGYPASKINANPCGSESESPLGRSSNLKVINFF